MPFMGSLQGHIHQGILGSFGKSHSFGTQCTAIALVALIFSGFQLNPRLWSQEDIDNIVFEGDGFYHRVITQRYNGDMIQLAHDDIAGEVVLFEDRFRVNLADTYNGVVSNKNNVHNIGNTVVLFRDAFEFSSSVSSFILCTLNDLTVSVFHDCENDFFYVFDSHSRDGFGNVDPFGAAVMLHFSDIDSMISYFERHYFNAIFNVSPIMLERNEQLHRTIQNDQTINQYCADGDNISSYEASHENIVECCPMNVQDDTNEDADIVNNDHSVIDVMMEHNYGACKSKKPKKGKPISKKQIKEYKISDDTEESVNGYVNLDEVTCNDAVATYVEVMSDMSQLDIPFDHHTSQDCKQHGETEYELSIRERPKETCYCCDRFLFQNQVHKLMDQKLNNITAQIGISSASALCSLCKKNLAENKMPVLCSKLNDLGVNQIPNELSNLSKLEKKLIAKIQTCMTMIILPGGQYAEKGMVLNLPRDINTIVNEISKVDNENACIVRFEAGNIQSSSAHFLVDPNKIISALQWLKNENILYNDVNIESFIKQHVKDEPVCDITTCDVEDLENVSVVPVDFSNPNNIQTSDYGEKNRQSIFMPKVTEKPVSVYELESGEESAFPWLFPHGKFGYLYPRKKKVSTAMYFRYRLYNKNAFWRKNTTYLLHAAVSYDTMLLKQEIKVYMKMRKTSSNTSGTSEPVTVADVTNINTNPDILQNSYMFMKNIRGTVAYFRNALYNLLAMFRTLGPPTLFITLSADDLHWPELGMLLEDCSYEEAVKKKSFLSSMREDPLMTALHFERRFSASLHKIILGPLKPLGKVRDYFIRVEFQNRCSPHYHTFFWIEDVPTILDTKTAGTLLAYIDSHIKTDIPSDKDKDLQILVNKLQQHSHSSYCMPLSKSPCRFGFPKRECKESRIIYNGEINKNKGKFYETKRSKLSTYINPYNPIILQHWRANMDIQVINNAEGAAYYVCQYLCKSEPDELRASLTNLIATVFKQNPNYTLFQKLWNIGCCVLKHRRLSCQEAAFRLSNLKLLQNSREIVYVNTRPLSKRFKMLKPMAELNELPCNSTDIFHLNMIDYYHSRPNDMEYISLYKFASWYIKCKAPKATDTGFSISKRMLERVYISKHDVWLRKRKHMAVVRYPKFSLTSDDYYYGLLMLLLPHRNESELKENFEDAKSAFLGKYSLLNTTIDNIHFSFLADVENAIRRIRLAQEELTGVNNQVEEVEINEQFGMFNVGLHPNSLDNEDIDSSGDYLHNHVCIEDSEIDNCHQLEACRISEKMFLEKCNKLTPTQKKTILFVQSHFSIANRSIPLRLFITGGAGVGKSFLTDMIISYLEIYTAIVVGKSPVKVCAPTGTAARNIGGQTIHSLLKIEVSQFLNYSPLTTLRLEELRRSFNGIHTLIIDEISMVSDRMMTIISRRLSEITQNLDSFGGYNVVVVGDFYQLRPIRGRYAFHNRILWDPFTTMFLQENVRQSENNTFIGLLNRARVGLLTSDDMQILKSKLIDSQSSAFKSLLHIYPLRKSVENYNNERQMMLEVSSPAYTINAEHYFSHVDKEPGGNVSAEFIPTDDRDAGNLQNVLRISVGTRIMLIRNILTQKGLVNGAMGTITDIICTIDGYVTGVDVLFDDPKVGQMNVNACHSKETVIHNPILISRYEHQYLIKGRFVIRKTFPLTLCWACTIHKVQGMSLDKAVLDLGSGIFERGMAYVALSRVRSLAGLFISIFNANVVSPADEFSSRIWKYQRKTEKEY